MEADPKINTKHYKYIPSLIFLINEYANLQDDKKALFMRSVVRNVAAFLRSPGSFSA
jgi:hypothetical protein